MVGIGVFLFVSFFSGLGVTGDTTYSVPNLYNKTIEEAQAMNEVIEAQFQIVQGNTVASDLPEGYIVNQTPKNGLNASAGATITVDISDGSLADTEGEEMPDVENLDYRIAVSRLAKLGFSEAAGNLTIRRENNDDVNTDYVISQDPAPKTPLDEVESVELVVSDGKKTEMVTVITFVGMTEEEARQKAEENLELVVSSVTEEYSDKEPGIITWQSIDNGVSVEKGSSISFRVSKGPDPNATTEPTTTPTPETSTAPTPTPGGGTVTENTISVRVDLPRDGRESVQVVVTVDGQVQYDDVVETQMQMVMVQLKGSGTQNVTVYFDGAEDWSRAVNFN